MKPGHYKHPFDGVSYFEEVRKAMAMLAENKNTLFIGQSVAYESNAMFRTLEWEGGEPIVPMDRRIELPVIEDFQMGVSIGMALEGFIPVSIFPRWDFLLLAANQLVNHLDKITDFDPNVIIRTSVGASFPFSSGAQQSGDYSAAFRLMLKSVEVIELNSMYDVVKGYRHALECDHSCLVVERQDLYN